MTNSNYKLTKEDFKQINKRSLFTFQLGWNYERMQASGYLYMLLPQLRKMYGDGTPELKEMMKLHTQFFNTSPFFHTIITGFDLALEEKDGVKSKDAVNGIKTGLMGPFAPLGDSIFGSLVPAIMGSIAATLAVAGNPAGIFLWIAVAVAYDIFRWKQLEFAYKEGVHQQHAKYLDSFNRRSFCSWYLHGRCLDRVYDQCGCLMDATHRG